jgi:hypothetical protein
MGKLLSRLANAAPRPIRHFFVRMGAAVSGSIFLPISISSVGDNTIVTAVTGQSITTLKWTLQAAGGAVNLYWADGAGNVLTGTFNLLANQPISGSYCPVGHFKTATGQLLKVNLNGAVLVSGYLVYQTG